MGARELRIGTRKLWRILVDSGAGRIVFVVALREDRGLLHGPLRQFVVRVCVYRMSAGVRDWPRGLSDTALSNGVYGLVGIGC